MRFLGVTRLNSKIPAPVEDAGILKVARRGFPHSLNSLRLRRFHAIDVLDDVPILRAFIERKILPNSQFTT